MPISRKLRGMIAAAALTAGALGAVSLAAPAGATQLHSYEPREKAQQRPRIVLPLNVNDDRVYTDTEAYQRAREQRDEQLLKGGAPRDLKIMRDGGPAPWEPSRF